MWTEFLDLVKPCDCGVLYSRVCLSRIYSLISSFTYLAVHERLLCASTEVKSQGNSPTHTEQGDMEVSPRERSVGPMGGGCHKGEPQSWWEEKREAMRREFLEKRARGKGAGDPDTGD